MQLLILCGDAGLRCPPRHLAHHRVLEAARSSLSGAVVNGRMFQDVRAVNLSGLAKREDEIERIGISRLDALVADGRHKGSEGRRAFGKRHHDFYDSSETVIRSLIPRVTGMSGAAPT